MSGAISVELIAKMWRDHANCTWVVHATEVGPVWSCGIIHQPTTRDRHLAELVMTQVRADAVITRRDVEDEMVQRIRDRAAEAKS